MDNRKDLLERIERCSQKDTVLGMFFDSPVGWLRAERGQAVADQARAAALGRKTTTSFFRYPVADLLRLADQAAQVSGLEYGEAIQAFGRQAVLAFYESPIGKTMSTLAGNNVHRLLSSAISGYKAVTSYGERTYERTGERSARLTFRNELLGPAWPAGNVIQALTSMCEVTPTVEAQQVTDAGTSFTLDIRW